MNRIADAQFEQAYPSRSMLESSSAPREIADTGPPPAHRLFAPMHYEIRYAYPLIVWLHGPNGDESEIDQVMPHISLRNYVGVSPRGTMAHERLANGMQTYTWRGTPDQTSSALDRVLDCVDLVNRRLNIAPQRVFLAGYGAGGSMALRLGLTNPEFFAGAASFAGAFPRRHAPLRNLSGARELPLFIAYGRDAEEYGHEELCDDLQLVHAAGLKQLSIRQYPCDDDLTTQMLRDFDSWVMRIVTNRPQQDNRSSACNGQWN